MKPLTLTLIALASLAALGCNKASSEWPTERRTTMNAWVVNDYHADAIRNGLVAEHTIYPHHFVKYGSELNELGVHDLAVLADHYRDYPGSLNVRRGGEADDLYNSRLAAVKDALAAHGVDVERIAFDNRHPGGDGMASPFVVVVIDEKMDEPLSEDKTTAGFFSSSSSK